MRTYVKMIPYISSIAAISPYFIACSKEGLYTHYMNIADAVKCPIYLNNFPSRTGNPLEKDAVRKLVLHPIILGITGSSKDINSLNGFFEVKNNRSTVLILNNELDKKISDLLIQYGVDYS